MKRIEIERVCQRWRNASFNCAWIDFKYFSKEELRREKILKLDTKLIDKAILAVQKRGGKYIQNIDVHFLNIRPFSIKDFLKNVYSYSKALKIISIKHNFISAEDERYLKGIFRRNRNLEQVIIPAFSITGECLKAIKYPEKLVSLNLKFKRTGANITSIMKFLKKTENLKYFFITGSHMQIDKSLESVKNLHNLEVLEIQTYSNKDYYDKEERLPKCDTLFSELKNLKLLSFCNTRIKDYHFQSSFEETLTQLKFENFIIDVYGNFLNGLAKLKNLETFTLWRELEPYKIDDRIFFTFKKCQKIRQITMGECNLLTCEGLVEIKKLKTLKELELIRCNSVEKDRAINMLRNNIVKLVII